MPRNVVTVHQLPPARIRIPIARVEILPSLRARRARLGRTGISMPSASQAYRDSALQGAGSARLVIHAPGFRLSVWQNNPHHPRMTNAIHSTKERTQDLTPVFRDFKDVWFDNEKLIFDAEGIPSWPRLSPNYAIRKELDFPGKSILRRTDRLWSSLTSDTSDTVYEYGPRKLVMGTHVAYSRHQNERRPHVFMLPMTWEQLNAGVFTYAAGPLLSRRPTAQLSAGLWFRQNDWPGGSVDIRRSTP